MGFRDKKVTRKIDAVTGGRGFALQGRAAVTGFVLCVLASCGGGQGSAPSVSVGSSDRGRDAAAHFVFDSLDERTVSSAAFRGRPTVLTFMTTGNVASQAQVSYLAAMARHDAGHVQYAAVSLDPRSNRELVEIYRQKLELPFPVALADDETSSGRGPFGDLRGVPTTFILDPSSHVVWRHEGLAKAEEIRAALSTMH
jgi:hypothetical protein